MKRFDTQICVWIVRCIVAGFMAVLCSRGALAQYARYPTISGEARSIETSSMPRWAMMDFSLRSRTEGQTAVNQDRDKSAVYDLTRVRVGLRVEPAQWLNLYVQAQDAHALGLAKEQTAGNMKDTFDLRQALVSLRSGRMQLMVGRQPLRFADERLVGISDWTNVSRTFDGIVFRTEGDTRLTLFSSSVVNISPESFDRSAAGLHFHGALVSIDKAVPKTAIEPFVFVKTFSGVKSPLQKSSQETEATFGAFVAGNLPGRFFYRVTGALQRGSYAGQSIDAGGLIVRAGYTMEKVRWKPESSLEYDYATGDDGSDPTKRKTFDQLYPSNHNAFGLTDIFGWQNMKQRRVGVTVAPRKGLTVTAEAESLHLATVRDGVYSGGGGVLAAPGTKGFLSDDLGTGFDVYAKYITGNFVTNIGVGHYSPGAAVKDTDAGVPQTIAFLSFTYRFRLHSGDKGMKANHHHLPVGESNDR